MIDGIPVTGPNLFFPKGHYWMENHLQSKITGQFYHLFDMENHMQTFFGDLYIIIWKIPNHLLESIKMTKTTIKLYGEVR